MSAVVLSSWRTSLLRYARSQGLWILLLVAPIGAKFMIAGRDAENSVVSVAGRVPWLTSPVLGMELGVVIATLLLPVAFLYLRANVTRRQPWQVEEPSPASRVAVAYGRWLADLAVLAAVLAATTAAGLLLALFLLPPGEIDPVRIVLVLWAIAGPPTAMVASVRILLDARPWTRGALGETLYFVFWMGSLVMSAAGRDGRGFASNMTDLYGFISPLAYARGGDTNFAIGGGEMVAGAPPIPLDVFSGVLAPGYLASRLAWFAVAALIPLLAGLIYAPHAAGKVRRRVGWLRFLEPGRAPASDPAAPPARPAGLGWVSLLAAEIRLIASGRLLRLTMAVFATAGWFLPYSTVIGPASMLLLVFAASAHAGRSEQTGLLALTRACALSPWARRAAFVAGGAVLALFMGAGAIAHGLVLGQSRPLVEAAAMGSATALVAVVLGTVSRSATAPRLVLLLAWYAYLNASGG